MIEQVSVYLENGRGAILRVLSILSKKDINVLGIASKDNTEFFTLRLVLSDTQAGIVVLQNEGYICKQQKVVGVELEDKPGAMEELLGHIDYMNMSIDYLYVGYARENNMPIIIFSCTHGEVVSENLAKKGYKIH